MSHEGIGYNIFNFVNMEAPKIPSFIKSMYQFKRFSFQPRYYNAEKENLEIRKTRIEKEVNNDALSDDRIERHARMKFKMEDSWKNRRSIEYRKSNIRIMIIIAILVLILYVIKQKLGI